MTDHQDPDISADLAAFPVMRAVLRARVDGTGATHSEVRGIVDDLEQRLGRDAVIALVGSLATKALAPLEDRARQAGTQVAAEIDAGEQHALAVLDQHRRGTSGM